MRSTPVHKALLKILSKNKSPLSAFDILAKLHAQKLPANKTTVYRQLALLEKQGLAHTVRLSDRSIRYELTDKNNHHHHLVCVKCNDVKDINFKDHLVKQEKTIQKNKRSLNLRQASKEEIAISSLFSFSKYKKFKILRHSLEFFGLCFNCQ